MNKLTRDVQVGYILHERKFRATAIASVLAGILALGALFLFDENDTVVVPTTQTLQPRSGPTFELPRSDDGPNSTLDSSSLPVEQSPVLTTLVAVDKTP